jgi:hypothetical protein
MALIFISLWTDIFVYIFVTVVSILVLVYISCYTIQ